MKYCVRCHMLTNNNECPSCGSSQLREAQNTDYCLVTEKEDMWARMLMDLLNQQNIPWKTLPVHGAAMTLKTGVPERYRIYVPYENLNEAKELIKEILEE